MLTKILVAYSTVVTTLLAAFTLAGSAAARGQDKIQQFDEINVHRINVREPDGTLRMVISNHARLPGVIVRGKDKTQRTTSSASLSRTRTLQAIGGVFSLATTRKASPVCRLWTAMDERE